MTCDRKLEMASQGGQAARCSEEETGRVLWDVGLGRARLGGPWEATRLRASGTLLGVSESKLKGSHRGLPNDREASEGNDPASLGEVTGWNYGGAGTEAGSAPACPGTSLHTTGVGTQHPGRAPACGGAEELLVNPLPTLPGPGLSRL